VLLALTPVEFAISFAIMVVVVLLTSNMRLGPAVGLAFLPLIIWLMGGELDFIVYSIALSVFCLLKSFTRLRADTARIGTKKGLIVDKEYKPWQKKR
jgi:glycerol-3-phosphate acyltransferase PlsY